jgi:urocanate hydratase
MSDIDIEVPKWDIALANLAREEFQKKGANLTMDDFNRLAREYTIRLDDIMVTMFEMVIAGEWQYIGDQKITRSMLNDLYINGRLHADDLNAFKGGWQPL